MVSAHHYEDEGPPFWKAGTVSDGVKVSSAFSKYGFVIIKTCFLRPL